MQFSHAITDKLRLRLSTDKTKIVVCSRKSTSSVEADYSFGIEEEVQTVVSNAPEACGSDNENGAASSLLFIAVEICFKHESHAAPAITKRVCLYPTEG